MNKEEENLIALYQKTSKHSNYQILPDCLKPYIDEHAITTKSRYEQERLLFMRQALSFNGAKVMDIGGNTGYFTFEAVAAGAREVVYVEGNKVHAEFVEAAAKILGMEKTIKVLPQYYNFDSTRVPDEPFDIVLLLNVLHHLGDDYGSGDNIPSIKRQIIGQLNSMSPLTRYCVFQLGFNWKGNRNVCLFEKGTKQEMIEYIQSGIGDNWEIKETGIAQRMGEKVTYLPLDSKNIERDDSMGEFLNRPLFILKSKKL